MSLYPSCGIKPCWEKVLVPGECWGQAGYRVPNTGQEVPGTSSTAWTPVMNFPERAAIPGNFLLSVCAGSN